MNHYYSMTVTTATALEFRVKGWQIHIKTLDRVDLTAFWVLV